MGTAPLRSTARESLPRRCEKRASWPPSANGELSRGSKSINVLSLANTAAPLPSAPVGDDIYALTGRPQTGDGVSSSVSRAASSFGESLAQRAAEIPDDVAFTLLEDGQDDQTITFLALHRKAQDVAALLREKMPKTGSALLLFPPGLDYL